MYLLMNCKIKGRQFQIRGWTYIGSFIQISMLWYVTIVLQHQFVLLLYIMHIIKSFSSIHKPKGPATRSTASGLKGLITVAIALIHNGICLCWSPGGFSGNPHASTSTRCFTRSGYCRLYELEIYAPKLCPNKIIFSMFICFRHSSMDSTNSCSAISGFELKLGLELRPNPNTSKAYSGLFSLRGPKFCAHNPTPPPIPCTNTSGTFPLMVSLSLWSIDSVHNLCWAFGNVTYFVSCVFLKNAAKIKIKKYRIVYCIIS